MKLRLQSQDLVKELSLAQGVVERKVTIPMLENVLLTAKDGTLELTTTNLELGFRTSCEATVEEEGTIALPMLRLYEYVRLLPGQPMRISTTPTDAVRISSGSAKTRISGVDPRNFPKLPEMPSTLVELPARPLLEAIRRTIISVSTETSHYSLAGALLLIKPDALGIVSTDGHRLSLYFEEQDLPEVTDAIEGLVPRKAMAELQKILEDGTGSKEEPGMVAFGMAKKNMFFQSGRRLFVVQKMTGKFPNYGRVLPKDSTITLELNNHRLAQVLRRVSQFSDQRSRAVRFELENGELKIEAAISQFGSSKESLLVDYEGKSVGVGFNAQYIIDFLGVCGSEQVLMQLRDAKGAAQFVVPDMPKRTDYRYVIMPIRV